MGPNYHHKHRGTSVKSLLALKKQCVLTFQFSNPAPKKVLKENENIHAHKDLSVNVIAALFIVDKSSNCSNVH